MGDSITAGYTDNPQWSVPFEHGYRGRLHTLLTDSGVEFEFAGASLEPFNNLYGDPTLGGTVYPLLDLRDPGLNQGGHRGYGGISINTLNSNVAAYLAADNPDLILLMIGINGISANSPSQLQALVNSIFTAKPAVRLVVAQIIPKIPYNGDVVAYNNYIRQTLVPALAAQGKNIATVDQYANFLTNPADHTSIDTAKFSNAINHPSNPAYQLMAATWLPAITPIALDTPFIPAGIVPGGIIATPRRLAPPGAGAFTFALVAGDGDRDNSRFAIQAGKLVAGNHRFDLDPAGKTYAIRLQATGGASGGITSQTLVLTRAPGPSVSAPLLIETFSSGIQSAYAGDVMNNDLLHGLAGTHLNYKLASGIASGPRINDGLHGADTATAGIAWASDGNITGSTFHLGAGLGAGFDISRITAIAAWNSAGFMNQKFRTSVRYSGASRFTVLADAAVDFQPVTNIAAAPGGAAGATKVVITRPGGMVARGIEEIRFTQLDTMSNNGGGVTLREIDVEGVPGPLPEPRMIAVDTAALPGGSVAVTWQSRPGVSYRVETSTGLSGWTDLDPAFPSDGHSTRYVDLSPGSGPRRFYRVRENP